MTALSTRNHPGPRTIHGQFGPQGYADWRSTSLGEITEILEQRLILRLAGSVKDCAVLDVGCGDGSLSLAFRRGGAATIVGCDVDPRMIARARDRSARSDARIDYALARAEQLPFRDDSFDVVAIVAVLAFVEDPQVALREIARVLNPGGRLVLGDLGKWSLWAAARRFRAWLGRAPIWNAARFRSAGRLWALTEAAGLRVDELRGAIYYPRSRVLARLMAAADPWFGKRTTLGAAFLAVRATKAQSDTVPP